MQSTYIGPHVIEYTNEDAPSADEIAADIYTVLVPRMENIDSAEKLVEHAAECAAWAYLFADALVMARQQRLLATAQTTVGEA